MFNLRNMVIKQKLIFFVMVTSVTVLLVAGTAFAVWSWISFRQVMVRNLSTQAGMISEYSKAALTFKDSGDAEEMLQSLKAEKSIFFGGIYGRDNKLFASYYRSGIKQGFQSPILSKNDGYNLRNGFLTVYQGIYLDGEKIGTICLQSNLYPMYIMLYHTISIIIGVLLAAFVIAYFMSSGFQRIISEPILHLAKVSKTVSDDKDYSLRAMKRGDDEIGFLVDSFNDMLVRIEQSNSILVNTNVLLNNEVEVRKRAEEKQLQLLTKLKSVNSELEDFAYVVSHDLKAPLRGIGTLAEWISTDYRDKLDDNGKEQIKLLLGRVTRMHNLIEGVLQYSRVGRTKEAQEEVNLNEVVPEVIDLLAPPSNISVTIENELPIIKCEKTRITQVFQNLISNAIKYMDKPEGVIKVGCVDEGKYCKFSVSDNGPGIEEKYFDKIFKIFQTLSARDEFESTGIGLTVVKKIVELYGGSIWVESQVGEGSTFNFKLPKQEMGVVYAELETNNACRG